MSKTKMKNNAPRSRRAAVLGQPIGHSLSPVLHRAAYEQLGLTHWSYERFEVGEGELEAFADSCDSSWAGLSLTMPLKQVALRVADVVEPLADTVGAVNTLLFAPGGLIVAANTDVYGIAQAIRDARKTDQASTAVIVGAGATAASAIAALGELGVTRPVILVRAIARAGTVIKAATAMGVEPTFLTLDSDQARQAIATADVLISTIPGGTSQSLINLLPSDLSPAQTLLDVVYEGWPTPLPLAWSQRGGAVAPGYDMLLYQAVEQVRLMTSQPPPVEAMRTALLSALS